MIGLISDVHSNIEALNAVLEELDKRNVDKVFFAGDAVGYGPNPNECCELLKEFPGVKGNHDHYCSSGADLVRFSANARKALQWTRERLSDENREYLENLPLENELLGGRIKLVHGSPDHPLWEYVYPDEKKSRLKKFVSDHEVLVLGHTHVPFAIKLDEGPSLIVNPGSVGQPRDNNPLASYALLDLDEMNVRLKRTDYDKKLTAKKIRDSELPSELAGRLLLSW